MIAIRLNKNIDSQYILNKIQNEINQYISNNDVENGLIYIEIKSIVDQDIDLTPKLENTLEK